MAKPLHKLSGIVISVIFYISTQQLIAQKENYYWCFGKKATIDFNVTPLAADTLAKLTSPEGSASIADQNTGQLLFYTDGTNVWDRNHNLMPNGTGLFGGYSTAWPGPSSSATQACIIVPACNTGKYYIFTCDPHENNGTYGFRYSIVDMSLNGGMGAVTTKKFLLFAPSTEKVTAFHHANKKDIWVITHGKNNNKFYAYLVTSSGVSTPVITNVGEINIRPTGYLKISPNGKKLVCVESYDLARTRFSTQVLDFDNATGIVSNPISLNEGYYGASFSPNSSKLYLAQGTRLDQYDMLAGSASDIVASRTNVNPSTRNQFYGLQMGPDGKIYCSSGFPRSLHVINQPDLAGTACNVTIGGLPLKDICRMGVPNFVESFFDTTMFIKRVEPPTITSTINYYVTECTSEPVTFSLTPASPVIDSIQWNYGDGSAEYITSDQTSPILHTYNSGGTYLVRVITYVQCVQDTFYTSVDIRKCDNSFFIPNTFTPDGNGINDLFHAKAENIEAFNMKIFDRWGNLIFESNNINKGWDGNYKGNNCQMDVYVWSIEYNDPDGLANPSETTGHKLTGRVTLLR